MDTVTLTLYDVITSWLYTGTLIAGVVYLDDVLVVSVNVKGQGVRRTWCN